MTIDRGYPADDQPIVPEDVDSEPSLPGADSPADPNDEIPVPIAMSPAEVDERAQVVDKLRHQGAEATDPIDSTPPGA